MVTSSVFDPNDMMASEVDNQTILKEQEEADKSYDSHVRKMFDSNSGDGAGWYLDHMSETFHASTTAQAGESYYTTPAPSSVPLPPQHPLRVIAKMFHDAPNGSVVRVYAYMLTDMDAMDLLAHHAKHKTVNVIIHPNDQSWKRMAEFFDEFGNSARRRFANVRVAPLAGPGRSQFTQMHIKGVVTESLSAFGSYNLTYPAKHASWEMITLKNTTSADTDFFDSLWNNSLPIEDTHPDLLTLTASPSRKRSRDS